MTSQKRKSLQEKDERERCWLISVTSVQLEYDVCFSVTWFLVSLSFVSFNAMSNKREKRKLERKRTKYIGSRQSLQFVWSFLDLFFLLAPRGMKRRNNWNGNHSKWGRKEEKNWFTLVILVYKYGWKFL